MALASVYSPPDTWSTHDNWDKTKQNMEGYPIGAYQPDLTIRTVMDYMNGASPYVTVAGPRDLLGSWGVIRELQVPGGVIENVPIRYNDVGSAIKADKTNPQGYGAQIDIPFDRNMTNGQQNVIPYSKTNIDVVPVTQDVAMAYSAVNNAGKAVPISAQLAEVPQPGVTAGGMGGLLGPMQFEKPAAPPLSSFFQGTPAQGIAAQLGWDNFFDPINMGSRASFRGPVTEIGLLGSPAVGSPVMPSLFGGPELSYAAAGQPPGLAAIDAALAAPQPAPAAPIAAPAAPAGAQLPGLGGMPPAGTFGAMPLGNYSMASVAQPAAQPTANVSISALGGPAPSLSLSGKAIADPLAALAGLPSDAELASRLPSPEEARASIAGLNSPQGPAAPSPAPTAYGTNVAPNTSSAQAPRAGERFWSERLPGEGELNPVVSVETAQPSAPASFGALPAAVADLKTPELPAPGTVSYSAPSSAVSIANAPTAAVNPAVGGFGVPFGGANISMATPTITTAAPQSAPSAPALADPYSRPPEFDTPLVSSPGYKASGIPDFGLGGAAAPAVNMPSAPVAEAPLLAESPRPDALMAAQAAGQPFGSIAPGAAIPGAATAVDIQAGLRDLPAPVELPSTQPTVGPGLPGVEWGGLANMNPPTDTIKAPPTINADVFSPSLTPQETIPTVAKAPDTPAPPAAPAGLLAGMPAPVAAPVAAPVVSRSMPAPVAAPSTYAAPSVPQQAPQTAPAAPAAFGALAAPQGGPQSGYAPGQYNFSGGTYDAGYGYGVAPVGQWNWNTSGNPAGTESWVPSGYSYGPVEQQIAATGSGPFGALADAFGGGGAAGLGYNNGSSFGYDYNNGLF